MPKTFILEGIGGVWNYGCEAIVRSTVKMLGDLYPDCCIRLVTRSRRYDSKALRDLGISVSGFRSRYGPARALRKVLRSLRLRWRWILSVSPKVFAGADAVLSIGGDIFTPHVSGLPWLTVEIERYLLRQCVPLILWGATVGPFPEGSWEARTVEDHLRRMTLITVRGTPTLEYIQRIGAGDRAVLVADPAFALDGEPVDVQPYLPRERREALVAVNFSPLINTRLVRMGKDTAENVATQCVQAVLDQLPVSVALVPHVVCARPCDDDHQMLRKVARRLGAYRDRISLLPPTLGVRATKYFLGQCDVVLAARMHCAISAMSMGVPTICVSYSMKSIGVLRGVYQDDQWVILLEDLCPQAVVDRLAKLLAERGEIARHLKDVAPALREQALLAGAELKRVLG
jgi:colanic acid/amylovoran biosynthesis protein